jgi:hypothetical protein
MKPIGMTPRKEKRGEPPPPVYRVGSLLPGIPSLLQDDGRELEGGENLNLSFLLPNLL